MSTSLADQLHVNQEELDAPLGLQLAVQGSRSKINLRARCRFQYQNIDEERQFDVINLSNYDLILGTPWMYQHQVCLGFNPARVVIGADTALPIEKGVDTKLMVQTIDIEMDEPLCKKMEDTESLPCRAINHAIPLIDANEKYPQCLLQRPEPFCTQLAEQRDAYLKTGRWKITLGNRTPVLFSELITNHKPLTHLLNQKNLSGHQGHWIEISMFDFEIAFIPETENVLEDALSRMYSNDVRGTVHARSNCTYHDVGNGDFEISGDLSILSGLEAHAAVHRRPCEIVPSARTGRPETSHGFSACMHDDFALRGPVERKEGEGTSQTTEKPKTSPSSEPRLTIRIKPAMVKNSSPPEMDGVASRNSSSNTALANLVSSSQGGTDLLSEIRKNYHKDPFFELILKKPNEYQNFEVKNGLVYLKEKESWLLCIPKVLINGRSAREIIISEAHSRLTHLGTSKTLDYLRGQVWWKNMTSDTKSFCETCMTCKRSKRSNQQLYELLNPLPILHNPWESIGMNIVRPLHESSNWERTYHSITVEICLPCYSILPDLAKPLASRTIYHSNLYRISEMSFVITDIFTSPVQHHTYLAAAIYACLTHEEAIRNDRIPVTMKDQSHLIHFDFLARVYYANTRGTNQFAYLVNAPSNTAIINRHRVQPDNWNITPSQRGIVTENFQQLMENDVARILRHKAQIERRQAAATHRTKFDSKLQGTKKALVSMPITSFVSLPITTTSPSVASSSAATLKVTIPFIATSSTADISMTGPIDTFTLTTDEVLAAFIEDVPFDNDTILFDSLSDTTI